MKSKTLEEVERWLKHCKETGKCRECPYFDPLNNPLPDCYRRMIREAIEIFDEMKKSLSVHSVDAEPVKHGRYENERCSVCSSHIIEVETNKKKGDSIIVYTPYCPYCGAKMDL